MAMAVIDIINHDYRQTFLLRNKIRNSESRFDRKAKELQPQLKVKVPYIKKKRVWRHAQDDSDLKPVILCRLCRLIYIGRL